MSFAMLRAGTERSTCDTSKGLSLAPAPHAPAPRPTGRRPIHGRERPPPAAARPASPNARPAARTRPRRRREPLRARGRTTRTRQAGRGRSSAGLGRSVLAAPTCQRPHGLRVGVGFDSARSRFSERSARLCRFKDGRTAHSLGRSGNSATRVEGSGLLLLHVSPQCSARQRRVRTSRPDGVSTRRRQRGICISGRVEGCACIRARARRSPRPRARGRARST